ncbi:DUF3180 domain-containing protein [Nocardioides sp. AE5]|uniref:DUF3180 domain-containing protein n=1 Tax=Nocardioides sp. AE5 TaxID=2962573 RepID=UPI002881C8C1|nr:DUF3180 domain-containing protein [Nocardioides sp. AE5]MDT0200600.1 DUF3180 domain-containing protein [Nocardioides sp. AE5]
MTRPEPGPGPSDPEEPQPHVGLTPVGALVTCASIGLIGGWALRPLSQQYATSSPTPGWIQFGTLVFVAAFLAVAAWLTRRTIAQRQWLEPRHAVNRLALAKACALVGAAVAGGYAGYAIGWIGEPAQLAGERMTWSALASGAAVGMCVAALFLERACRVPDADDPDAAGPGAPGN